MAYRVHSHALIMVIEDNADDFKAMERAFEKSGLANEILHFQKAEPALDYLYGEGEFKDGDAPLPGIVLLDINLPGIEGIEMLTRVKSDNRLQHIPVVILTTSTDERDINACYAAGANSYIRKPVDLQGFVDAIVEMKRYWLEISVLPVVE